MPAEPIPQIDFDRGYVSGRDKGRKMLDICLDKMLTKGGYVNLMSRVEYFLDWLLYGFGHPHPWFKELPSEPRGCVGCSMVLYQLFDLFRLLYRPNLPSGAEAPEIVTEVKEPDSSSLLENKQKKYKRPQAKKKFKKGLFD